MVGVSDSLFLAELYVCRGGSAPFCPCPVKAVDGHYHLFSRELGDKAHCSRSLGVNVYGVVSAECTGKGSKK